MRSLCESEPGLSELTPIRHHLRQAPTQPGFRLEPRVQNIRLRLNRYNRRLKPVVLTGVAIGVLVSVGRSAPPVWTQPESAAQR